MSDMDLQWCADHGHTTPLMEEISRLRAENAALKKALADIALIAETLGDTASVANIGTIAFKALS